MPYIFNKVRLKVNNGNFVIVRFHLIVCEVQSPPADYYVWAVSRETRSG